MKGFDEILNLEKRILGNSFVVEKKLWGGAGFSVELPVGGKSECRGVVYHKEAYEISTLLYSLKEIIPYNFSDKYELFELLLEDLPQEGACLEILKRAKIIYKSRTLVPYIHSKC